MTDLTGVANSVIDTLKSTKEYREYSELLKKLKQNPALFSRVNEFREKNFTLQQSDSEDLFDRMDALTNEYEDVINIEMVTDFIKAEAEFCRLVQKFTSFVTNGLEFD